ncbi:MAG: glycerophosphodiester phosphodiesterase family protein [Reichenbachiella sp.]|uniref:glycerophosphodiester phosphodiesterase family protein n=1 Tax=Reichenbachiella sp. TaxID=2184521 RepID=UPI003265B936
MKTLISFLLIGTGSLLISCKPTSETKNTTMIDVQGHRGARGLLPENTIPAFIKAVELGVTTLELDLAVTAEKELLVSHEPYMGAHLALDSTSQEISKQDELNHNIYQMTYDEIKKYDVGSKFIERFPKQEKFNINKPLLSEVVDAVNQYLDQNQLDPVNYNIEIKSQPEGDSLFHPKPDEYARLVYEFITSSMDTTRLNVQSFDFRILKYYHQNYPEIKLAALVENEKSIEQNLTTLGFNPEIYSCYYKLLDHDKVAWLQAQGIKVIPWTVNEPEDIEMVIGWGVDGIISDYPNRVLELISN